MICNNENCGESGGLKKNHTTMELAVDIHDTCYWAELPLMTDSMHKKIEGSLSAPQGGYHKLNLKKISLKRSGSKISNLDTI